MANKEQPLDSSADAGVLRWVGRVVAFEDLRQHLNGHRELILAARAIITPLAAEHLRARGVHITRQTEGQAAPTPKPGPPGTGPASWAYFQDRPSPLVQSAVQSLGREGLSLKELQAENGAPVCRWAKAVAECVARGECRGGVIFCADTGLVCCVANKVAGLRAVAVTTVAQAARATLTLGPNLAAVEMPGRTLYEVRQILRTLCRPGDLACPDGVACTLGELDGHAHR